MRGIRNLIVLLLVFLFAFASWGQRGGAPSQEHPVSLKEMFKQLGKNSIPALKKAAISSEDMEIRVLAIRRLGELQGRNEKEKEEVRKILSETLTEGQDRIVMENNRQINDWWKVRAESALALAKLKSKKAIKPLVKTLRYDKDKSVRIAAAIALGNMGFSESVDALIEELEKAKDNELALELIRALGKIGDPKAFNVLLNVTKRGYLNVVKQAAQDAIKQLKWE